MKRILVADDEEILRMLITDTIEDSGYEVEEATDGKEALDKLQTRKYDLVILDYMMPHLTGVQVIEQLNDDKRNRLNILMLTAKTQESDKERMRAAGACYLMAKPFSPYELLDLVKEILG